MLPAVRLGHGVSRIVVLQSNDCMSFVAICGDAGGALLGIGKLLNAFDSKSFLMNTFLHILILEECEPYKQLNVLPNLCY